MLKFFKDGASTMPKSLIYIRCYVMNILFKKPLNFYSQNEKQDALFVQLGHLYVPYSVLTTLGGT